MQTLKLSDIKPGMKVVFVDDSLNVPGAHVQHSRASVPLGGLEGVVVRVDPRTDHDATCASKKPVAEGAEHEACDCTFSPGKQITVVLKDQHKQAHTCDGFAPDKRGVWARADHFYTPEAWAAHKEKSKGAAAKHAELDAQRAAAAKIAAAYLGDPE